MKVRATQAESKREQCTIAINAHPAKRRGR